MMAKSQEMLAQANRIPIEQAPGPGFGPTDDGPRWYHENVDPTLQNMLNSVNKDDMVIHDAVTGANGNAFLDHLTKHQWQDDGLAAGGLFDWVAEDAQNDPTGRAASTAHSLADYTADHQKSLLNIPGADNQSLGQVNPELTRDMSRAFAPYLDDMVGNNLDNTNSEFFPPLDGGESQATNTRALMSVMYTDSQASETMYRQTGLNVEGYVQNAANSLIDGDPTSNNSAMLAAGKLQSALDLASFDETYDRTQNQQQAVQDSYSRRADLFDSLSGVASNTPIAGIAVDQISPYMKDVLVGPPPPNDSTAPTAPPRSDFPVQVKMAEALLQNQVGDPQIRQWLLDRVGHDGHLGVPPPSNATERGLFYDNITSYFEDIRGANTMMDEYWKSYSNFYLNAVPSIGGS
jgi:hypothetical protein